MDVITVFLSSTFKDLQVHRNAAREVLQRIDRVQCIDMERFGARAEAADPYCRELVARSDLYLGLLGHCYGSCPAGASRSFTEGEFDAAVEAGCDQLVFLLADDAPVPAEEPEEARRKQRDFRSRVRATLIVDVFNDAAELALKVSLSVNNWLRRRDLELHGAALVVASRSLGRYCGRAGNVCFVLALLFAAGTMLAAVLAGYLGQGTRLAGILLFLAAMVLGALGFLFWDYEQEARMIPHRYVELGESGLHRSRARRRGRTRRNRKER